MVAQALGILGANDCPKILAKETPENGRSEDSIREDSMSQDLPLVIVIAPSLHQK